MKHCKNLEKQTSTWYRNAVRSLKQKALLYGAQRGPGDAATSMLNKQNEHMLCFILPFACGQAVVVVLDGPAKVVVAPKTRVGHCCGGWERWRGRGRGERRREKESTNMPVLIGGTGVWVTREGGRKERG